LGVDRVWRQRKSQQGGKRDCRRFRSRSAMALRHAEGLQRSFHFDRLFVAPPVHIDCKAGREVDDCTSDWSNVLAFRIKQASELEF
jgi:hypothetical protein